MRHTKHLVLCLAQNVCAIQLAGEKKCKKAKWLSEEAIKIAEKRSKRQKSKGKIYSSECRVPKNSKER